MHVRAARSLSIFVVTLSTLAALAFAPPARASEGAGLKVDWPALADAMRSFQMPASDASSHDASHARVVLREEAPWFAHRVLVSLVARDWEGASRLAGGPLAVSDAIRTSRSSRMVMGRIGLGGGRFVPFVQVGFGQWRDPDPHRWAPPLAYAAQTGAGLDMRVAPGCALAVEYDWTMLYLDAKQPIAAHLHGAFAVARLEF